MTDVLDRLQNPPFGTETSERNLMSAAADEIVRLRNELRKAGERSQRTMAGTMQPRVTDNDQDAITVKHGGKVVREYSYRNDDERRERMIRAREYVEGWCAGGSAAA